MAEFQAELVFNHPVAVVFDFHITPANLVRLLPSDTPAQLVEAPLKLELDQEFELQVIVWGISQQLRYRVLDCSDPHQLITQQIKGPFRAWREVHRFQPTEQGGTRLQYAVQFEPPGGMLGLMMNAKKVVANLEKVIPYRQQRTQELLDQHRLDS